MIFYRSHFISKMVLTAFSSIAIPALASVSNGVPESSFAGTTIERFNHGASVMANTYDFGKGLSYANLVGDSDYVSYIFSYGMGYAPGISSGKENDGYFGTNSTPTSFQFSIAQGTNYFGFYGAESDVDEIGGRDAVLVMNFYGANNDLLGSISESTPTNVFAWDQFHGFYSSSSIYRVEFIDAGHMVIDNMMFAPVPEPETYAMLLMGLGVLGFMAHRRKNSS